jgi:leucine dehydrogenase
MANHLQAEPQVETSIFDRLAELDHEQVIFCSDPESGLKAIIGIHDTRLGPALGGTRMWKYASESDALRDVLRLSRGMTYKAAVAGLNLGGGKAVIIGDPHKDKSEALFRSYGRYLEGLAGRYITAEDVGITVKDIEYVRLETKYVTGIPEVYGGSGDPSPYTALGVYQGMKACAKKVFGSDGLVGKKVAIQGAGNVSSNLARLLSKEGAKIFISDIYSEKAEQVASETGATIVEPELILEVDMDIFSPCALGGILNDETIPNLKCAIVAGAANNQLEKQSVHGRQLIDRGIVYAPDYVLNAGGLINVSSELEGYHPDIVREKVMHIYDVILNILHRADDLGITAFEAADHVAEERLRKIGRLKQRYASTSQYSGRMGELTRGI